MVMEIMYLVLNESVVMVMVVEIMYSVSCARIAQWLECRTQDCMVTGLSPCRSSGRILGGQLSVLTLISGSVLPPCYHSST